MEEIGYTVSVGNKVCSAEMYSEHPMIGHFHLIQTYYVGDLLEQISTPTEEDHVFEWVEYNELVDNMYLEMQGWTLKQCVGDVTL